MPKARAKRCTYKEGSRRCPYDGDGVPSLCHAHRIALAEIARPKPPGRVLLDSLGDFLQGKPINREATIGAAEDFLSQWANGLGSQYHPDMIDGESEDSTHRRGQSGTGRPWWWNIPHAGPRAHRGGGQQPPHHPEVELLRARLAARQVMGFTATEKLDAATIKTRHRELVRKNHPDGGGSHKKMAAINAARDILEATL